MEYDNLLYSCIACNSRKSDDFLPNPSLVLIADAIEVHENGTIEAKTRSAKRIIRLLYLDRPKESEFRKQWIEIVRLAAAHKPDLYRALMAYPNDLPDLSALQPPGGNTRPDGVERSHFRQRERRELPETY